MWVASAQLGVGLLLLAGIWLGLPARYALVDVVGNALAAVCLASAFGLFTRRSWGKKVALIVSWATLVIGASTVTALCLALSHLAGLYGPIGSGGALLLGTIAALVLPYLVGLPLLQVGWLSEAPPRSAGALPLQE
jgi:hypothetical protein